VIEEGASVIQGQELFYFPDLSQMEVVAMLNETVVDRVRAGMPARVRFESLQAGEDLEGHVDSVDSLPKRSFNDVPYYPCRVKLEAAPAGLLPGMTAKVEVQLGRYHEVLAIPNVAVSVDHDRKVCYVIGPSDLDRREITPGASSSDLIEVVDGLKEGELVVLDPSGVIGGMAPRADSASLDPPDESAVAAER
jgi:multidrug efflux pump subunit AcrA (membrane-fusion protein)